MKTAELIKKARIEKGLTQRQLAEKLSINAVVVSQYERGNRNPKIDTLQKIAGALGVPLSSLLFDNVETLPSQIISALSWDFGQEPATQEDENRIKDHVSALIAAIDSGEITPDTKKQIDFIQGELPIGYTSPGPLTANANLSNTVEKEIAEKSLSIAVNTLKEKKEALQSISLNLDKLNSDGQQEAVKRVEELTQIPKYTTPESTENEKEEPEPLPFEDSGLMAAHNDNNDPDQMEKMMRDLDMLGKLQ